MKEVGEEICNDLTESAFAENTAEASDLALRNQYLHRDHHSHLSHHQDCTKWLGDCSVFQWGQARGINQDEHLFALC